MSALFSLYSLSTLARALRICVPMALLGAAVPPAEWTYILTIHR